MEKKLSRRQALGLGGSTILASMSGKAQAVDRQIRYPKRVLRVAHLTDIHVQPELGAALGMERCLDHAQSQNPDLIITGGDLVMDCLSGDLARAKSQWDLFQKVIRSNISTPIRH